MNRSKACLKHGLLLAGLGVLLLCLGGAQAQAPQRIQEILGVAHVNGQYAPYDGDQDYLNHGAEEILTLGSETIKIWFTNPHENYPYHADWPEAFDSLVAMARHPYFQALFDKPFKHCFLMAYPPGRPDHYWRQGVTKADLEAERRDFEALMAHLLESYAGSGKTFVIQHWEGDWAIRGNYDDTQDPTPTATQGMIAWLNARQDGVNRARAKSDAQDVAVYHAAEVNKVLPSMREGRPNVVNTVLPHTRLDLVSYSCWETMTDPEGLRSALDYIAEHLPASDAFGERNVYLGEFGWPENENPQATYQNALRQTVETALDWGCPYLLYWQLYCNEALEQPVENNDDVRGFWLIRPDGARTWTWDYLKGVLQGGE